MKILVIGGGGREHAIIWKLRENEKIEKIYCAPGNAGIQDIAECIGINVMDFKKLKAFALQNKIDLTIVGPDDPLAAGIVDVFQKAGLRVFGPNKRAAVIESSKSFSKNLMKKNNIPTAKYEIFDDYIKALEYIQTVRPYPIVIKADGLALGKGVLICKTREEAVDAIKQTMIDKKFGDAGKKIVIEEFLEGQEVSVLAFCDGETIVPMVAAQDHKRVYDNDEGLNTGGMGTFSPSRIYNRELNSYCKEKIFIPTVKALNAEGRTFKGIIFFGLIVVGRNIVKVIEYNARFGDPETQVVLPRLDTDLLEIIEACIDGTLDQIKVKWKDNAACCVVLASGGYPESYEKGYEITGLEKFRDKSDVVVFHAGTALKDAKVVTNGGRVLGVTGIGTNLDNAIEKAYQNISEIKFKDVHYRNDIGTK